MASRRKKPNQTTPKSPVRGTWSSEEDQSLTNAVEQYGAKNWKKIAELVPGRSDVQCLHRWQKVLNPALIKGPWTDEEDEKVKELVATYGAKKWSLIASFLPGRIGKQCRERWANHLDPNVKKGDWTPEEDEMIIKLQRIHGNKWAKMTKDLPGRTDNAIKNRFNSTIQRRLKLEKSPSPKTRKVAHKIAPSSRSPASPLEHETVSNSGITKRYPSRSTSNRLRIGSGELSCSPSPSSPASLASLHSYTSEDDFDDNFVGESDDEQSDNTISSDGDFEDPEIKEKLDQPGFTELVELCATDLRAAQSGPPKIVLCQETPQGTRLFDTAEVVGAAALSDITFSPCRDYASSASESEYPLSPSSSRFTPLSPRFSSPLTTTSAFSRPKRSTAHYGPPKTSVPSSPRTPLSVLSPSSHTLPISPLRSAFTPLGSPSPTQPRQLRQFISPLPQGKRAKRRLELTEEEEIGANKRPQYSNENTQNPESLINIKNANTNNTNTNTVKPILPPISSVRNTPNKFFPPLICNLPGAEAAETAPAEQNFFLAPAKLVSLEDANPTTSQTTTFKQEPCGSVEDHSSLASSDGGFVASLALCELTRRAEGINFPVEV